MTEVEVAGVRRLGPAVVLVEPQLGENIGSCARAMLNCGVRDLRLVRPRDGWPNPAAVATASGATEVLDAVTVHESVESATADLSRVFATTARPRDLNKPVRTPEVAGRELQRLAQTGADRRGGWLFGCERTGLDNDAVALATDLVHVPLHPDFRSLNLAQAVLLHCWEWRRAELELATAEDDPLGADWARGPLESPMAPAAELYNFFEHLEQQLDHASFFRVPEKRAGMIRNLRSLFARARPSEDELRTLHGVVAVLSGRRKDGAPVRRPSQAGVTGSGRDRTTS